MKTFVVAQKRMNKSPLFLLMIFFFFSLAATAAPKNESDIRIDGGSVEDLHYTEKHENLIKWCKGSVPSNVDLNAVKLSPAKLKEGVSCVVADFDGDGYLDFVLYGAKESESSPRSLLVLFFHGKKLLRSQVIRDSSEVVIFDPKDPERKKYPGKTPSLPALIRPGEGDRGWVYFLNKKTGLFEEVPWVMPPDYE